MDCAVLKGLAYACGYEESQILTDSFTCNSPQKCRVHVLQSSMSLVPEGIFALVEKHYAILPMPITTTHLKLRAFHHGT